MSHSFIPVELMIPSEFFFPFIIICSIIIFGTSYNKHLYFIRYCLIVFLREYWMVFDENLKNFSLRGNQILIKLINFLMEMVNRFAVSALWVRANWIEKNFAAWLLFINFGLNKRNDENKFIPIFEHRKIFAARQLS